MFYHGGNGSGNWFALVLLVVIFIALIRKLSLLTRRKQMTSYSCVLLEDLPLAVG